MLTRTCDCGQEFTTYPSVNKRHCSMECSSRYLPRKKRTGKTVACEQCGTEFYQNVTEARKGRARFCSVPCHNLSQGKASTSKACAVCGNEMLLKPSQVHRIYCSRACMGTGKTQRPLTRLYNDRPARLDHSGYVLLWEPSHPNKSVKGWQPEHRLVIERSIGRYLTRDEQVHHVNGVKDDNRLENLEILSASDHSVRTVQELWQGIAADRAELAEYRRRFGPLKE